jgi:hypothetical protein
VQYKYTKGEGILHHKKKMVLRSIQEGGGDG